MKKRGLKYFVSMGNEERNHLGKGGGDVEGRKNRISQIWGDDAYRRESRVIGERP